MGVTQAKTAKGAGVGGRSRVQPGGYGGRRRARRGAGDRLADADDAPVPGDQGAAPGRDPLLPARRLLRDVLRGRACAPRSCSRSPSPRAPRARTRCPCAGCPYHSARRYIAKLIEHGLKVAICEQVEEAGSGPGHRPARGDPHHHPRHGAGRGGARAARQNNFLAARALGRGGLRRGAAGRLHRRVLRLRGASRRGAGGGAGPRGAARAAGARGRRSRRLEVALLRSRLPAHALAGRAGEGRLRACPRRRAYSARPLRGGRRWRASGWRTRPWPPAPRARRCATSRTPRRRTPPTWTGSPPGARRAPAAWTRPRAPTWRSSRTLRDGGRKGTLLGVLDRTATGMGAREAGPVARRAAVRRCRRSTPAWTRWRSCPRRACGARS